MSNKDIFLNDVKSGENIKISLMVMRIMFKDTSKVVAILADKSGDIKATIPSKKGDIVEGRVISVEGKKDSNFDVKKYEFIDEYEIEDYLPTVKRPVEDIMEELELYTDEYILSREGKSLNNYFFKNEEFLEKFKKAIGGVSMHHNYIGGLAEHTLGVMYLSIVFSERYNCKNKEIAILAAKLHDIGKIYEMSYDGPFKYTLQGEMEGHIVIGIQMLDKAFESEPNLYSDEFKARIKGCIVQHHGKTEFGSPKDMNMEESYIVHYADYVDATMNKIEKIKEKYPDGGWTDYDRKLEARLYL
ncbi:HD domain-containing protein [Clostridium sp. NSJ-49]|uniref:3'-5' exoribonuclease YhaM family protein n=1 Tax=Clostridium TaxID=1485 RepID=UPI00164A7598|nr:3'-5' exoribonuclease YhaM family protein [Clostridium sp. NSJ-49]MBC5624639.1 HD domain-containing protein [Clostridium sp. NSJ-49]